MPASETEPRSAEQNQRAKVAYHMAYTVLPRRLGSKPDEFAADFEMAPDLIGLDLYREAARDLAVRPHPDDLLRLRSHTADLHWNWDTAYLFEYPRYSAVGLLQPGGQLKLRGGLPVGSGPYVLAPYFSAVLIERELRLADCYTLAESVDGTTQVRVQRHDDSRHLGPGCEPTLKAFLRWLRTNAKRPDFDGPPVL